MKDEVVEFIRHFQNEGTRKVFLNGCCFWFARILIQRFSYLEPKMMYSPIDNHFAVEIYGQLYDITGEILYNEDDWIDWPTYYAAEYADAQRVEKNCILKID